MNENIQSDLEKGMLFVKWQQAINIFEERQIVSYSHQVHW
jgi:hypothetical protein